MLKISSVIYIFSPSLRLSRRPLVSFIWLGEFIPKLDEIH